MKRYFALALLFPTFFLTAATYQLYTENPTATPLELQVTSTLDDFFLLSDGSLWEFGFWDDFDRDDSSPLQIGDSIELLHTRSKSCLVTSEGEKGSVHYIGKAQEAASIEKTYPFSFDLSTSKDQGTFQGALARFSDGSLFLLQTTPNLPKNLLSVTIKKTDNRVFLSSDQKTIVAVGGLLRTLEAPIFRTIAQVTPSYYQCDDGFVIYRVWHKKTETGLDFYWGETPLLSIIKDVSLLEQEEDHLHIALTSPTQSGDLRIDREKEVSLFWKFASETTDKTFHFIASQSFTQALFHDGFEMGDRLAFYPSPSKANSELQKDIVDLLQDIDLISTHSLINPIISAYYEAIMRAPSFYIIEPAND